MTRTFLAAVFIAWSAFWMNGAIGHVDDAQPTAFGPRIIDLSLHVDKAATHSLRAAPESAVPATMTFRTIGDRDQVYDVMVHVKGQLGSARSFDNKPAFKIKLGKGERFLGLEQLTLNNMVQDPTMLHEALGYQVYAAAGVAVPDTGYVRLTVNGQAYGLYLNVETIDPLFLERRFGDDTGILYEGNYGVDLRAGDEGKFQRHEGNDPDHAQLTSLIQAVHSPGDGVFYGATARVDTLSFLSMMAVEALLADWDNYYQSNNYRIYWNPSVSRWYFIPTGIDQIFGGGDSTTVFGATGLLFQKCLASERCTKDYADAVREVAARFERLGLATKMDALLSVIDAASQADLKKPYHATTMKTAREAMRVFIVTRPNAVRAALSCMDGGHEATFAACAGAVAMNPASDGCMDLVSRSPKQNSTSVRVARCHGGVQQRWRLVATGDAFELEAISTGNCLEASHQGHDEGAPMRHAACSGTDSQLFSLRPGPQDTQIVAKQSRKCVAIAPGDVKIKTPPLIQATCSQDASQTWRVQRSIFR